MLPRVSYFACNVDTNEYGNKYKKESSNMNSTFYHQIENHTPNYNQSFI